MWTVAMWHHATFADGPHKSSSDLEALLMIKHVLPLLEDAGVDLVLNGHSHAYERSFLLGGRDEPVHTGPHDDGTATRRRFRALSESLGRDSAPYRKTRGGVGLVAVVMGSSGQVSPRRSAFKHELNVPLNGTARGIQMMGTGVLDTNATTLSFSFVDDQGTLRDSFHIEKY